jgi:hypothetical protein
MSKSKSFVDSLSSAAIYVALICLMLVIFSLLFPDILTNVSKGVINSDSYTDPSGGVRRTIVNAQVTTFAIFSTVLIVFFTGLMTGFHTSESRREASSIAVGGPGTGKKYLVVWGVVALNFALLGNLLPRVIFNPTNEAALSQYYSFFASARNGWFMGSLLGIFGLIIVILLTMLAFTLVVRLRQKSLEKKYKMRLQHH